MAHVRTWPAAIGLLAGLVLAGAGWADVLYSDDFSGASPSPLNGTAPDVRPGAQTWAASALWFADGSKPGNGSGNAWLPFIPAAGNRYNLSLDVNPANEGSTDWFAIGYSASSNTTVTFQTSPNNTVGWMLMRENYAATDVVQTFLGPGTSLAAVNYNINPDKPEWVNLRVALDTRNPAWTVEWFIDGSSIRGPVPFGTNPTINYVGFGGYNNATGFVDNFLFSRDIEPTYTNPPIAGLFGTGLSAAGAPLADGAVDPHYSLIQTPDPTRYPTGNAIVEDGTRSPISDGTWLFNTATSKWIGPEFYTNNAPGTPPEYVYRYILNLAGYDPATAELHGYWATDNTGIIYFNENPTGNTCSGFASLTAFSITSGFVPGINFLDFHVGNGGTGFTGLRVETLAGTAQSGVPEPATLTLLALGGLSIVARRRRGRAGA